VLRAMSATVRRVVGGTSGPLYAILLMRAAARLAQSPQANAQAWAAAFRDAVDGVIELGGARPGERTMIDALLPAADTLQTMLGGTPDAPLPGAALSAALQAAVEAAEQGAAATASMLPRRGRSSYLGQRAIGHADPGAHAVALWLGVIRDSLKH